MNIPTPRTEAVMVDPLSDWNDLSQLARQLETELSEVLRERDEAREKLSAAWQSLRDSQDEVLRLTFENRELRNLSNE